MDKPFIGRIYKIVNDIDDRIYIGSTRNTLRDRMYNHRGCSRDEERCQSKIYRFMREVGVDHFQIFLLEEKEVKNRDELVALEDEYIMKFDSINKGLNEFYATLNLQRKRESRKKYVEEHKEEYIKTFNKCRRALRARNIEEKRFVCDRCGYIAPDKQNLERHIKETKRCKGKVKEERTPYFCFLCNAEYRPYTALIQRHNNTAKHQKNIIYVK